MWLQSTGGTTKHAKGNDDWEAIITKEQRSHLKRLSHIKGRKEKGKWDFWMTPGSKPKIGTKDF